MKIFEGHNNIIFCLSGGKDSLAALHMVRDHLDKITVLWCNTGSAFPEDIVLMDHIKSIVPNFVEVISDNKADIVANGLPVDILPYTNTEEHAIYSSEDNVRLRSFYSCCSTNRWLPMQDKILELGATLVIRGQKNSDTKKAKIRSGEYYEGIQFFFPLEDMTDKEVYKYIADNDVFLPEYYKYTDSSLDCWNCTAFLFESVGKFEYMKKYHKILYDRLITDIIVIKEATKAPIKYIDRVLEYVNI